MAEINRFIAKWGWCAVVVIGMVLYAPSLTFTVFHFDDKEVIVENTAIQTLRHPERFFLDPSTGRATEGDLHGQDHGYRPLLALSFAADYAWSGADGRGYRAVNLAVHVATAVLSIGLCRALGLSALAAWLVGVVMVVHPVHVQIIDYISSRSSGLSAALVVGAAWAYLSFRRRGVWGHYVLALTVGAAAILTKESAVVLPVLLAVIEWTVSWSGHPLATRHRWRYLLPFVLLSGVLVWLRVVVFGSVFREVAAERSVGLSGMLTAIRILTEHVRLWVYPIPLSIDHPMPLVEHAWTGPMVMAYAIAAAGAGLMWYGVRSRSRVIVVGTTWYVVSLAPSLVLPFVVTRSLFVEHRAYAADVGLALFTVVGGLALYERANAVARRLIVGLVIVVVATWSVLTVRYEATWKTHVSPWTHAVLVAPDNISSQIRLGQALFDEGRDDEALAALLRARALNPFDKDLSAYVDSLRQGRHEWLRVIVTNQDIIRRDPKNEAAQFNLAVAYQKMGAMDQAKVSYQAAIALWPGRASAHSNLGVLFLEENRLESAIDHFQQALGVDPSSVNARYNLATAYIRVGKKDKARQQYIDLLRVIPETPANTDTRTAIQERLSALDR